ncbi:MAG: carboxymuconolactone decarboxylase family protein [Gammaproteobacteria bacterium]|nr:carboxymuconolactone decarboxylase family protein [Gammaproteobacteria bacterium]
MSNEQRPIDFAARRQRGLDLYQEIMRKPCPFPRTPRAAAMVDFVFAEIWSRPGLGRRARRLVSVSCAAGASDASSMRDHAYAALASGDLSYDELLETVLHVAVYAGWPRAEALERIVEEQWRTLHAERGESPPERSEQPWSSLPSDPAERKRLGQDNFIAVNAIPYPDIDAPYVQAGILDYVFADMWLRPGLDRRDRRWITLACVGFSDSHHPIQSHVYSALKTGDIEIGELREMVLHFAACSGWPKASFLLQNVEVEYQKVCEEGAAPEA